ncbi:MAG: beta-N-acetylhexosaminidase [Alistipes sp.]|nr:beta-N-acetylhexosaminidase [Alistipes sp.]
MSAKRTLLAFVISTILFAACGKLIPTDGRIDIIPLPGKVTSNEGHFVLKSSTKIIPTFEAEGMQNALAFWNDVMLDVLGQELIVEPGAKSQSGNITIVQDGTLGAEAYRLKIDKSGMQIAASTAGGVFYAFQTLRQLLPTAAFTEAGGRIEIPACEIEDAPHFEYRGFMFDMGRHIFSVQEVKDMIDILAMHKINKFHWHLTEDQGWRIEIKKYPKLTEIGSIRKSSPIGKNKGQDGKPYGGFFTQEEVRDVVKYAAERFITVIPEIEIPGHSVAALASYPELGCTGEQYEVATWWGVDDRVICPGKELAFTFWEDVLTEVMELFPSEYIHIGGDECPKTYWKKCPDCQARMHREGLKNEEELQAYVTKRVEKFLNEHGRKIIGWDEILQGGVTKSATVMAWRGPQYGIEAAKLGNHVIMSPKTNCYLDYYQSRDVKNEPFSIGGYVPVEQAYALDPYKELNSEEQKYVLGVQGNLWTEYISKYDHAMYMTLPRMSAIAEVGWSYPNKNYESFLERLPHLSDLFDVYGYNYAKHVLPEKQNPVAEADAEQK